MATTNPCKFNVPTYTCSRNLGTSKYAADLCEVNAATNRCVLKDRPPSFNYSKQKRYSDQVSNFPLAVTKMNIPKLGTLLRQIKEIVDDNWQRNSVLGATVEVARRAATNKLETRSTFASIIEPDQFEDMYTPVSLNNDPDVLVIGTNSQSLTPIEEHDNNNTRQLQSIASDFNNMYFLRKNTRMKFLFIVISAYNAMIKKMYASDLNLNDTNLNIMFKGGNVFRTIIKQVIREFNQRNENYLEEKFRKYIKEGDYDFEIVSVGLKNATIAKINIITQIVTLAIRNWLLRNNIFDFLDDSASTKRKKLKTLRNKLDTFTRTIQGGILKGARVDYVEGGGVLSTMVGPAVLSAYKSIRPDGPGGSLRTDFSIIQNASDIAASRESNEVGLIKTRVLLQKYGVDDKYAKLAFASKQRGSAMYCTFNGCIRYRLKNSSNDLTSFSLSRIKYNYIMYFHKVHPTTNVKTYHKLNVSGELLDVSHGFNEGRKKNQNPLNVEKKIRLYTVRNTDLSFYSMSMFGAMRDHEFIVLDASNDAPWTMPLKYKKRLYRTVIVYVFLLLTKEKYNIRSKIHWLMTLIKEVDNEVFTVTPSAIINRMKDSFQRIQRKKLVGTGYAEYKRTLIQILGDILAAISSQYRDTRNQVFRLNEIVDL